MKRLLIITCLLIAVFQTKAQNYKLEGNEVKISKQVSFEPGTDKLKPESNAALQIIKQYLTDKSYISQLRIEGHTANDNDADFNQKLSERRALAVCKKLIEMGVDCKRLVAVGFGDTKPVADNSTPQGKAENRRVSFINVALRGKVIGGLPVDGGGQVAGDVCN
jgi:OmpA-OmpF porin, OOP family